MPTIREIDLGEGETGDLILYYRDRLEYGMGPERAMMIEPWDCLVSDAVAVCREFMAQDERSGYLIRIGSRKEIASFPEHE